MLALHLLVDAFVAFGPPFITMRRLKLHHGSYNSIGGLVPFVLWLAVLLLVSVASVLTGGA